jgi:hypothetical protein
MMMRERAMSPVDVVKTFITALQAGEMEEAAGFMTDDFVERGWTLNSKHEVALTEQNEYTFS